MPRLSLYKAVRKGGIRIFMHVEFSAPKILFGNNFDELTDEDFNDLCRALVKKLRSIGIMIFDEQLKNAKATTIHYNKNIVIDDYSIASSIIKELSNSNISIRKNADIKTYKNDGEAIHFYTSKKAIAIYDKVNELNKSKVSEKVLIEKDNYCQLSLFDEKDIKSPFEVVRVKTRYNSAKTIKDALNRLNISINGYTFKDLYSSKIAKQLLKDEFETIENGILEISNNTQTISDFVNDIQSLNPKANLTTIMQAIAMKSLMIETGSRDIRKILNANPNQWSRLISKMKTLRYQKSNLRDYQKIKQKLNDFKTIKLSDYEDKIVK